MLDVYKRQVKNYNKELARRAKHEISFCEIPELELNQLGVSDEYSLEDVYKRQVKDATAFLETFFKLYPTATEKELAYYVKDGVLAPVSGDYVFSELVDVYKRQVIGRTGFLLWGDFVRTTLHNII